MIIRIIVLFVMTNLISLSCVKSPDEVNNDVEIDEIDRKKLDLTEFEGDLIIAETLARKYCVWRVTSVVGDSCKYKAGDNICYRCDEDGCPPGINSVGRNFGDGCRTFGEFTDTNCEEREDGYCAGKYLGP